MSFKRIVCFVFGLALLCACNEEESYPPQVLQVDYATIQAQTVLLKRELPGRVSAFNVSEVRPQVSGIIKERLFEEGSDVKEGQVLYQIEPELFETAYNSAKANLEGREAALSSVKVLAERYQRLIKTATISKQDYDDVMARYKQAIADVDSAKQAVESAAINLGYTKVRSPISGRIGRSFVTPGALVTQNQPNAMATVQQLSPVYVDVTQSSSELLKLQRELFNGELYQRGERSARVRLKLEDGTDYVNYETNKDIIGKLLFSDITVAESTGSVTLRVIFENPQNVLLPGMYVSAIVEEGARENSILIPQSATMRTPRGEPYVYILTKERPDFLDQDKKENAKTENKALPENEYYVQKRSIEIDRDYEKRGQMFWLVKTGLKDGEKLLCNGFQKVHAGSIVELGNDKADELKMTKRQENRRNG